MDTASLGTREERQAARYKALSAEDPQYRDAYPIEAVVKAKRQPGLRLAQIVKIVMEGYADRPALGQRATEVVTDPKTGRKTLQLLPRFDTRTYRELWDRACATAAEWHGNDKNPIKAGDFVCLLGFTSPAYGQLIISSIHIGAVIVPLQTSAPASQHAAIMAETEPKILATSVEYVENAVEAILVGHAPQRLIVFDYDPRDDDQRDKFEAAQKRLADAKSATIVDTMHDVMQRGKSLPAAPLYVPPAEEDPLAWLFYTSGSTGTPKGAIFTQSLVSGTWLSDMGKPTITLSFMPMSHLVGNGYMLMALANGGTSYCAPKADLSTLFEDFALARPTSASIVPRVCELFYQHFLSEVDRRIAAGANPSTIEADVKTEMRDKMLGGRLLSVGCGSASLAPETYAFMESMLDIHMAIGYSSTEIAGGTVLVDWKVQRPPVIAYKLADVPELGYFNTDKPYPRGELLVKTDRFMGGYYKRPDLTAEKVDAEGFYRTGDVMAEHGPDHLVFVDRCNNVVKLSQGEFVAISRLEAEYSHSPALRQIYLYGSSERAFLLAVVVPSEESLAQFGKDPAELKAEIRRGIQQIADEQQLNSWEVPRDLLIETEPFSLKNGLLSEIGKHQRPKLKERYGERLEQMYAQMAQEQIDVLRALRGGGKDRPVLETVSRALQATLGIAASDINPDSRFSDMGGDSLSALNYSILLEEIFGIEVPVGDIINPAGSLRRLAAFIETARNSETKRASFASVHRTGATKVYARELTLDKFIDESILAAAPKLPHSDSIKTALVTGATGFLGRFQMLAWLRRLAPAGGKVICIVRAVDAAQARQRLDETLNTDPALMQEFRALADKGLEVLAGDIGAPSLGLDEAAWNRLADSVDVIVHPAAHVNHVLPYNQLFGANVLGTAELIRLAITAKRKRFHYVSTGGVNKFSDKLVDEDSDVRKAIPSCDVAASDYANGYGISKWAGEVMLREAYDLCGLPVSVFRPGMILAHTRFAGQLNVPDMFTRLLFSLAVTGIAPSTFYAQNLKGGRPRARYEGFAVDFLADSLTAIGERDTDGFHSYNCSSPHDDGASLDSFVDWMIECGCKIERIDNYDEWLSRFETAMRLLPEEQRQETMLAILDPYRKPQYAASESKLPIARFTAASEAAGYAIPHLSAALINKYVADLRHLKLL